MYLANLLDKIGGIPYNWFCNITVTFEDGGYI